MLLFKTLFRLAKVHERTVVLQSNHVLLSTDFFNDHVIIIEPPFALLPYVAFEFYYAVARKFEAYSLIVNHHFLRLDLLYAFIIKSSEYIGLQSLYIETFFAKLLHLVCAV